MLRDYQTEMKARLDRAWRTHRSVMVQMPTGTGKTHLLASVVGDFLALGDGGGRVWLVAHRRELVEQIGETLARYGIRRTDGAVRVLSVQWLSRHWDEAGEAPQLIVVDEAHHATAPSYAELWKRYPAARKLGVTATPCRMNRRGFTELFEVLLASWSVAEFIGRGVLSVFDYVSIRSGSEDQRLVDSLEKRGADGDYQVKEMDAVLNRRPAIERLYRSVRRFAPGRKGMVYAVSIGHARRIAEYYSLRGLKAVAIDSRTPAAERRRLVEEFRRGAVEVLVNVDVFSEGFDCPDVEFVQLARPTLSLAKYLQQVGRGLRRSAGKEACVLIDNVGLYRLFGLPTREWDWQRLFEGRMPGKGGLLPSGRMGCAASAPVEAVTETLPGSADGGLVVIMEHGRLLSSIAGQALPDGRELSPSGRLRAFADRRTGLWGLERGDRMLLEASFPEAPLVRGRFAAVRLGDGRVRVVDDVGAGVAELSACREAKFLKDDLLLARVGERVVYVDLRTGRRYSLRPRVLRYGGVELLQVGRDYYSRTRQPYTNRCGLPPRSIVWADFYVLLCDPKVPPACRRMENEYFCCEPQACLLAGDEEQVYYLSGRLPDGSIVVADAGGRYYHVEKGGAKRYVACNRPSAPDEDFDEAVARLRRLVRERMEGRMEKHRREAESRRRELLARSADAVPYQAGTKWGLRMADRILIPPVYRKLLPPVGGYCAFQDGSCQWGVLAVDGRVAVPARYMAVEMAGDGMARLTLVPGKVETVRLEPSDDSK